MGLGHLNDSDNAADLAFSVVNQMVERLREGLAEKGNAYNTKGPVNVALFFEAFILPLADEYRSYAEMWDLVRDTKDALKKRRDKSEVLNWDGDEQNKKEHLDAYDRMLGSLDEFLNAEPG